MNTAEDNYEYYNIIPSKVNDIWVSVTIAEAMSGQNKTPYILVKYDLVDKLKTKEWKKNQHSERFFSIY